MCTVAYSMARGQPLRDAARLDGNGTRVEINGAAIQDAPSSSGGHLRATLEKILQQGNLIMSTMTIGPRQSNTIAAAAKSTRYAHECVNCTSLTTIAAPDTTPAISPAASIQQHIPYNVEDDSRRKRHATPQQSRPNVSFPASVVTTSPAVAWWGMQALPPQHPFSHTADTC